MSPVTLHADEMINPRDLWRSQALDIHRTLLDARADLTRCHG